jgi:signal transduction histidine kinase
LPEAGTTVSMVLDDIRKGVTRADKIVRGLLDFSAPNELSLQLQDLNVVIQQSLLLVKTELMGGHIEISMALDDALPSVELDENKIQQVFINLITNAAHAMPKGGTLSVVTGTRKLAESDRDEGAKVTDRLRVGDTVVAVEFCDTGHGIPSEKLGVIYDPFFTTKPSGKGTGLGLTVSRKIVELHGGQLRIANRPEGGVKATVVFPVKMVEPAVNSSDDVKVLNLVNA